MFLTCTSIWNRNIKYKKSIFKMNKFFFSWNFSCPFYNSCSGFVIFNIWTWVLLLRVQCALSLYSILIFKSTLSSIFNSTLLRPNHGKKKYIYIYKTILKIFKAIRFPYMKIFVFLKRLYQGYPCLPYFILKMLPGWIQEN